MFDSSSLRSSARLGARASLVLGLLMALGPLAGCDNDPAGIDGGQPDGSGGTDAGVDSGVAEGDAGPDAGGRPVADAGPLPDPDIGNWIDAINAQEEAQCRCTFSAMGFSSQEECNLAHTVASEPRSCAVSNFATYTETLGHSTACSTLILNNFATCINAIGVCNSSDLNECEMGRALASGDCPDAAPEPFAAFLTAVGECGIGDSAACPNDTDDTGSLGAEAWTGNTFQNGDDHQLACAAGSGTPDASLRWTAPAAGSYTFDTFGSDFDTVIAVLDGCGGTELACNEDIDERRTSSLTLTLTDGQVVIIVVDGFNEFSSGDFVVNITQS